MLDAVNYQNGQKNNWRRQGWNTMTELLNKAPKDALVLYLPGTTNLDEEVALKKGYRRENLIAVERDKKVAKRLRRELKVNVIHGDLVNVLFSWPNTAPPVDLIVADLQCGLTETIERAMIAFMTTPGLMDSVIFLNAMRGRDKGRALAWAKAAGDFDGTNNGYFIDKHFLSSKDDPDKHRGVLMARRYCVMLYGLDFWKEYREADLKKSELLTFDVMRVFAKTRNRKLAEIADRDTDKEINVWRDSVLPDMIALPGYRSTPRSPMMDGVIIKAKEFGTYRERSREEHSKAEASGHYREQKIIRDSRRNISAALAHRTMRIRGKKL